jgi:CheY-like chemotaxis protein
VHGDTVRLEQVLVNLVTNAIKYTEIGGRIDVFVETEGDHAVIRVADTGAGIAPDMLGAVFDPFRQAARTLDRARGGLGIGLTLVRTLVELHGGSVRAASEGIGKGSEFSVRLPLVRGAAALPAPKECDSESCGAPLIPRQLILVEDNEDVREPLRDLLQEAGHSVLVVGDGAIAVERALAQPPELMLVDIGLPGIDGYEVARRVRAALGDRVQLIALTGYGQPDDRRRALDAGFDAHLTKPVTLEALGRILRSA